jgi:hypothetical protein
LISEVGRAYQRRSLAKVVGATSKFGEVGQLPRKIISTEQSTTMQRFTNSELIYPFIYGGLIVKSVKDGS